MQPFGEPTTAGSVDSIAGLVSPLVNPESLAAVLKHLRHEGKAVQSALRVQGPQDLLLASNLYPVVRPIGHDVSPPLIRPCKTPTASEAPVCRRRRRVAQISSSY